ncbi:unnamed protein product [Macrosiphum euphorbiae]|uniref:BZIP domain-containing protein n=1 Tax=Macrosiphum euphorbiae TaxID=13131 RepID=A0AAV0W5G1_9HEMI|nr:unnamed protein product [Macrosiphum euphorbiae]
MYKEPATQRKRRLERARINYQEKKANEGSEAKRARLDKNRQAKKKLRAEETPSMKNKRLLQQRELVLFVSLRQKWTQRDPRSDYHSARLFPK